MNDRYDEDFNVPEQIKIDMTEYFNLKEDLEYYRTFKNMVFEETQSEEQDGLKIQIIKELVEQLEKELHH